MTGMSFDSKDHRDRFHGISQDEACRDTEVTRQISNPKLKDVDSLTGAVTTRMSLDSLYWRLGGHAAILCVFRISQASL